MTLIEFFKGAKQYAAENPVLRKGQAFANYLYQVRPDLANEIRSTSVDPFYQDENLYNFNTYLERHWS